MNATALARPALRVTAKDCGAGFFALLIYALNQLIYAESHGYAAHVDFGERCRDGRINRYYSAAHGTNVWDYFFLPVAPAVVPSASDVLLTPKQLFNLHHLDPESIQTYPHGVHRHLKLPRWRYDEPWHWTMRSRAYRLLSGPVRLKPPPLHVVRTFYREHILARGSERPLLGLHLRGTDKLKNIGGRIIGPAEYQPLVGEYLTRHPNALIFLATDSPAFLAEMRRRYPDTLVVYDALRSERNVFIDRKVADTYKKGEDALVDALLLSCANLLIKPASALSEFAVYWNPQLHNHTLELQYEVGLDVPATLKAHLSSERDRLRGFERCAPVLRAAA